MRFSRRTLGMASVGILLIGALGGVYLRFQAVRAEENGPPREATAAADGGRPEAASGRTFSAELAIPVVGAPVVRDTLVVSVSAAGQARAFRRALLAAEVAGPVRELRVREGQWVEAGRIVARIDPERYRLALGRAKAELEAARARFRELTLFENEVEDPELRAERRRMARAKSGLGGAEIAVKQAELDVRRATVRAPFAGSVANLSVVPGQRVAARDSICEIVDLSRIRVQVQALETGLPYLEAGREARVTLSAFPDTVLVGRVASINPVVDPRSRTARVTVVLPNPERAVKPGMYARVRIAARLYPDRVLVPRQALLERDDRTLVFVFEPNESGASQGFAKWTYVTTGLENERYVEIGPGAGTAVPEPGEVVLTDGHYTLIHDARVRLVESGDEPEGK